MWSQHFRLWNGTVPKAVSLYLVLWISGLLPCGSDSLTSSRPPDDHIHFPVHVPVHVQTHLRDLTPILTSV
jgi:hypothetical protein